MSNKKPLVISIELSQHKGSVAARLGNGEIVEIAVMQGDRKKDAMMPALEKSVTTVGGNPNEIDTIFVSIGPGSFTGLRVAVATTKMLSYTTGATIIPIKTALGVVCADKEHVPKSIVVSAIKKENFWLSVVTKNPKWNCEGGLVNASQLPLYIEQNTVLYCDSLLTDEITKMCTEVGVTLREMQSTATSIMAVGSTLGDKNHIDPALLLPLYPREPEAVRMWKEARSSTTE